MTDTAVASIPSHKLGTHLTAQQQQWLRSLIAEQIQIHSDRAANAAAALDDFSSSDSPHEREIARETMHSLLDGLHEYEDALKRLDSGTYGVCHTCAQPIPFERLEAIPEAEHCVACVRRG